jgi:acyl carrier protein
MAPVANAGARRGTIRASALAPASLLRAGMDDNNGPSGGLEHRIFDLVAEESDTPRETLGRGTALMELGDSLTRVETVMELEEAFEVALPDEEIDEVRTLGELVDLVDAKVRGRQNPDPHGDAPPSP